MTARRVAAAVQEMTTCGGSGAGSCASSRGAPRVWPATLGERTKRPRMGQRTWAALLQPKGQFWVFTRKAVLQLFVKSCRLTSGQQHGNPCERGRYGLVKSPLCPHVKTND